jgi:hypothetical protein
MPKNKFLIKLAIKIIIALIIIALSATAVYFLSRQITKINLSLDEKKEMDYLIVNRETVNNKIKTDFLEVDPNYQTKINESIPSVYNVLSFVDAMESLSKKYSFKQTLSFDQPIPVTDINGPIKLNSIKFNLTINDANGNNFISYLQDFEKLPYFASIDSINYLGTSDSGWQNNSSINITGNFYAHQ